MNLLLKQQVNRTIRYISKVYPCTLLNLKLKQPGTKHNSEYPATLRSAQIGSGRKLPAPTSGTRGTL